MRHSSRKIPALPNAQRILGNKSWKELIFKEARWYDGINMGFNVWQFENKFMICWIYMTLDMPLMFHKHQFYCTEIKLNIYFFSCLWELNNLEHNSWKCSLCSQPDKSLNTASTSSSLRWGFYQHRRVIKKFKYCNIVMSLNTR